MQHTIIQLSEFAAANGGAWCFPAWPSHLIRQYLAFHLLQRTLAYVIDEDRVVGLGVAWRQHDDHQYQFDWQHNDDHGNTIVVAEVIATKRGVLPILIERLFQRWQDAVTTQIVTYRRGRLSPLHTRYFLKLIHQEAHHGH